MGFLVPKQRARQGQMHSGPKNVSRLVRDQIGLVQAFQLALLVEPVLPKDPFRQDLPAESCANDRRWVGLTDACELLMDPAILGESSRTCNLWYPNSHQD